MLFVYKQESVAVASRLAVTVISDELNLPNKNIVEVYFRNGLVASSVMCPTESGGLSPPRSM